MRIDELKQALESQYLHEGHSLLSTDGSFPYSNKDIELVCGSLVTVRNETLQIVHLTVKQYIQSPSGPTTLRLLTETKGASLQSTLACLSFLKRKCVEPIAQLFPERPIDVEDDVLDLSRLYSKDPFLEYACLSWMVHLMDCVSVEALEASRSIYETFNSPSTFGWIESCMTLQSESASRLLISLEDARDWVANLQSDGAFAEDISFLFVSRWCITMEQVLKEYSPVFEHRPAEIYYLDLASTFALHGLSDLYEQHGGLMRREKCSRFCSDKIPKPPSKEVPPGRQLANFKESMHLDFLLYEPNRDIYIWSAFSRDGPPLLFTQSASSGRQLQPLADLENAPSDISLFMRSHAMSEDGGYLGIVYRNHRTGNFVILIWEIELTLNFTRRMQAFPWARVIHRSTIDEQSHLKLWSNPCITFDPHGVCYTPNGLVRTALGAESFAADNPLQRLSNKIAHEFQEIQRVIYSGNGQFLFVSSETAITKYTFADLEIHFKMSLSGKTNVVSCSSLSGRYLAFVARDQPRSVSGLMETQNNFSLVDTLSGETMFLPHLTGQEQKAWDYGLCISIDEREAVVWFFDRQADNPELLSVYHYAGLPNEVYLRAQGKCTCDSIDHVTGVTVTRDHRAAHYITVSGEIQRVSLGDEIKFLDTSDRLNEYPSQAIFLSQDGSRWAGVYYGSDKAQIQIYTVLKPTEHPQCIEFQRTSSFSDGSTTFMTMSMDLSVVILDWEVYSLNSKPGECGLTVQTLKLPRDLGVTPSALKSHSGYCSVDSSNEFVVYFTKGKRNFESSPECSDLFALFRINFDETSACRLHPSLPEDMIEISAEFHPSISLLIIGFGLVSEALVSGMDRISYHMVLIDMDTMSKRAINAEQSLYVHVVST